MPELPEVETIIRGLRCHLVGHRIASVEFRWPALVVGNARKTACLLKGLIIHGFLCLTMKVLYAQIKMDLLI